MAIPQLGTPLGSLLIIAFLWYWTLKRARVHLFQQEVMLRQQNSSASWSYFACILFQLAIPFTEGTLFRISLGIGCSLVFLLFIVSSYRHGEGFWAKKRNQFIVGCMSFVALSTLPFFISDLYILPIITALLIANICQGQFVSLFTSSLRDLEALQAKLLKQEALLHNERQLDNVDTEARAFIPAQPQGHSRKSS